MTAQKRRPQIGDECWEVEWCDRVALIEGTSDIDPDCCGYSFRRFPTRGLALAFAVRKWPETTDKLGLVMIRPMRFAPEEFGDDGWEYCGETEHISDASGETEEAQRRKR